MSSLGFAQKDSLQLGDNYAEDQLYFVISYNELFNQPSQVKGSGFSYGLSTGYIKDITLNKQGTIAVGLGVGYNFDSFNHGLKVTEVNNVVTFEVDNTLTSSQLSIHNLEFPLEIRWRTSTAKKYDFWRIYAGIKFLYNLSNTFEYSDANSNQFTFKNIPNYRKLQYGLTLSAGYDEFNVNVFYGLTSIFENATINGEEINTKILKFGLMSFFRKLIR